MFSGGFLSVFYNFFDGRFLLNNFSRMFDTQELHEIREVLLKPKKVNSTLGNFIIRKSGFHLLTPSPWPIFSSFAAFLMLTGFAAYMNYYAGGLFCFYFGVFMVILAFLF